MTRYRPKLFILAMFSICTTLSLKYISTLCSGNSSQGIREYASFLFEQGQMPRVVNKILTEYRMDIATKYQSIVDRNLTANHPEVVALVREMMDKPSEGMIKLSLKLNHTSQSAAIMPYLEDKGMVSLGKLKVN